MADSDRMEEAMVVIQEASSAISQLNKKYECNNSEVIAALKELTNKATHHFESASTSSKCSDNTPKSPPLYVKVSMSMASKA